MRLVDDLNNEGYIGVTFEDDFRLSVPSVEESQICRYPEVDKVVITSHSPGAISEYSGFIEDPEIKRKLVVMVPSVYHPFLVDEPGYLTSVFWRILVEGGQVIPFDDSGEKSIWMSLKPYLETYKAIKTQEKVE